MKTIRILAIADLHDRYERLRSLREEGLVDDVDLIAVCGDLHDGRSKEAADQSVGALSELAKASKATEDAENAKDGQPVLIVPGNTDPRGTSEDLWKGAGFSVLHRSSLAIGGCTFMGIGGIVPRDPKRAGDPERYYFSDEDMHDTLAGLQESIPVSERKVVLTHQPPRGILDTLYNGQDSGSTGLLKFLDESKPDLLICGHIHEARGEALLGKTRIVNVGELRRGYCAVIELGEEIITRWHSP